MIATERLVLRPPALTDLPFIQAEINTAGMMAYLGGKPRTAAEVEAALEADIAAFASGDWLRWTVLRASDNRPVGRVGLFRVRTTSAPEALRGQREIGWMLAQTHQGQGYASEAAKAVLAHGFGTMECPVIFSQTSDSNRESTRMMARLGFARAPELDYVDPDYPAGDNPTTVYRLDRADWIAAP